MEIDSLPKEVMGKVIEVVERTISQIDFTQDDLTFLFDVWNTYIAPNEKQDQNCSGCRTRVIGKYRMYVKSYRQNPA